MKTNNGAQSNPGSFRKFDPADGVYIGSLWGATPTTYIQFLSGVLNVVAATGINLSSQGHTLSINSSGIVLDGKVWSSHEHTGVQNGSSNTGGVV